MKRTLLYNAQIITMVGDNPHLLVGAVGVVGDRIELVTSDSSIIEEWRSKHKDANLKDCNGWIVMPGLINTHCHVAMTLQRGMADDIELMSWLNDYDWPFESTQSDEDIEIGAQLGIVALLLSCTPSFVDMYWSEHYVARAVERLGIRAMLMESCLDGERMESCRETLVKLLQISQRSTRIKVGISPHAPYTCSPEILRECVELSGEYDIPITTHLSESPTEAGIIRERYDSTPAEYLDKYGILSPSTLLAHCIHLTENDISLLRERGVSVAHNPQSNMKISSGVAPIARLHDEGVNCTISTDGVCSNHILDMWDEMRSASFLQKLSTMNQLIRPADQILKMATVNGAKAMGREGELGVIQEGALADIIVINTDKPHFYPRHKQLLRCETKPQ